MAEMVGGIILEVAKCFVPPTERQFNYLSNYDANMANLKREVGKLKGESTSIQLRIDEAKRKGEEILDNVAKWVEDVNKLLTDEAEKFIEDAETATNNRCLKSLCPNLKARYQLSKKAVKMQEAVAPFLEEVRSFQAISYRAIVEDIQLKPPKDYEALESRLSILKSIVSALNNPDVDMIGIYGMGGVGKTTLAKEVARQVEIIELFDSVVFAEVSPSPHIKKIQGEIADKLGLTLSEESVPGRANKLCDQLKKEKKILIILDNIWDGLDLRVVGIPHGDDHKGCKVLLTARSEDVLTKKMDSKRNFSVGVLKEEEAWSLFKKMAGDYIEDSQFKSVAKQVANECAGLPVAIVTVARALRNSELFEWKDALKKLRKPSSNNFEKLEQGVYPSLRLSYEKLEGEELKKLFLLIAYTYITSIEDLLVYGMGLGFFQGVDTVEDARNRVKTLVHNLKTSCMLLDGVTKYEDFSMHDVIRDVGISIASKDHHVFTARDELIDKWKWPDGDKLKLCTLILLYDITIREFPQVLEFPQLKFFLLKLENQKLSMPKDFFASMAELRVLALIGVDLSPLPSSIGLLTNLRALYLRTCAFTDMVVIGSLKKLEILRFSNCNIKQLPIEIRQLTLLKVLDLRNCYNLKVIPPNVISYLSHLEELFITSTSIKWDVEGHNSTDRRNANLEELKCLPNLTNLELSIKDDCALPKYLSFEKLEKYKIQIGERSRGMIFESPWPESCRVFKLYNDNTRLCLKDKHIMKLKGIEKLCLHGEQEMKNVVFGLDKEGFPELKHLDINRNPNLLCIVESSSSKSPRNVFPNLQSLYLENLDNLKTIYRDINENQVIQLSQLSSLVLRDLSKLTSFCSRKSINMNAQDDIGVQNVLFNEKVALPKLEELELRGLTNIERIWQNQLTSFQNMTTLIVVKCNGLVNIVTSSTLKNLNLVRLQRMEICICRKITEIIANDEGDRARVEIAFGELKSLWLGDLESLTSFSSKKLTKISSKDAIDVRNALFNEVALPKLEKLELRGLTNIERIWQNQLTATRFPNLTTLAVSNCDVLVDIVTSSTLKSLNLVRLQSMNIYNCERITKIIANDEGDGDATDQDEIVFGELKFLQLRSLESLTSFSSKKLIEISSKDAIDVRNALFNEKVALPKLEELMLDGLTNIERIWQNQLTGTGFQNLTTLRVWRCYGLVNIVTSSTLKSLNLVRLQRMYIYACKRITEIIANDEGDGDAIDQDEIVFGELKRLSFDGLKSLTCFYSGNHTIKFPNLEELRVKDCPRMKTFSEGEVIAPKLYEVLTVYRGNYWSCWKSNVNTTMQHLHEEANKRNEEELETSAEDTEEELEPSAEEIEEEDSGYDS